MSDLNKNVSVAIDDLGQVATLKLDASIYTLTAALKAAYWFTELYYIQLRWEDDRQKVLLVDVRPKDADAGIDIEDIVAQFANAVLDQVVRERVNSDTRNIRDVIVKRAFSEALSDQELKLLKEYGG